MVVFTVALTCRRRGGCGYPKCSYRASEAQAAYEATLSSARSGVCATEAELAAANEVVVPLVKQGWSFEAIWLVRGQELPFGLRTAYRYQEKGLLGVVKTGIDNAWSYSPLTTEDGYGGLYGSTESITADKLD